jgi:S-formylglutathione hydrolase FrmB
MLAGYSMGGFGAVKTALKYPERFCAAYSLSGSFGSARSTDEAHKFLVFGPQEGAHRRANDPLALAPQVPRSRRPALAFDCGKDDVLLSVNREFHHLLTRLGWDHRFREHDGGHDWAYWDERLPDLLLWARQHLDANEAPKA